MRGIIACACVTFCCACLAQSQPPTPSGRESSQQQQAKTSEHTKAGASEPRGTATNPLFVKSVSAEESASEAAYKQYEHQEKPTLDRLMGWGTFWLAVFTALLFVGTGILAALTYLLWKDASRASLHQSRANRRSLRIARRSADAALQAAEATQSQAQVTAEAFVRSHRGWIGVVGVPVIVQRLTFDQGGATVSVRFRIRNSGNSPAIGVAMLNPRLHIVSSIIDPRSILGVVKPDDVSQMTNAAGFFLLPNDERDFRDHQLKVAASDFTRDSDGSARVYVSTCFIYRDELRRPHATPYIFQFVTYGDEINVSTAVGGIDGRLQVSGISLQQPT